MSHDDYVESPVDNIPDEGFIIEFPEEGPREAGILVQELEQAIQNTAADADQTQDVHLERLKARDDTQDFGTILGVVLGAKATIEIAKGISAWLRRKNQTKIRIRTKDGRDVVITNLESKDANAVLNAIALER